MDVESLRAAGHCLVVRVWGDTGKLSAAPAAAVDETRAARAKSKLRASAYAQACELDKLWAAQEAFEATPACGALPACILGAVQGASGCTLQVAAVPGHARVCLEGCRGESAGRGRAWGM